MSVGHVSERCNSRDALADRIVTEMAHHLGRKATDITIEDKFRHGLDH